MVDQFVFEILVVFVESLSLAHSDEPSMGNFFSPLFHDSTLGLSHWWNKVFRYSLNFTQSHFFILFFAASKAHKQMEIIFAVYC